MRVFRLHLLLLCVLLALCSCHSSRNATENAVKHTVALQALEKHSFVIEAYQFYIHKLSGNQVVYSSGSQLSLQGTLCSVQYEPKIFPNSPFHFLNMTDKQATCSHLTTLSNGDEQYLIKFDGGKEYLRYHYLITLYHNSNECYVQQQRISGKDEFAFRGRVLNIEQ